MLSLFPKYAKLSVENYRKKTHNKAKRFGCILFLTGDFGKVDGESKDLSHFFDFF